MRIAGCNIVFGDFEAAEKNLQLAQQHIDQKAVQEVAKERVRLQTICKCVAEVEKCWCKSDWRGVVYYSSQIIDAAPKMYSMVTRKAEALVYHKKVDDALNLMADVLRMDDKNVDAIFIRGMNSLPSTTQYQSNDVSFVHIFSRMQGFVSITRKTSTKRPLTSNALCN